MCSGYTGTVELAQLYEDVLPPELLARLTRAAHALSDGIVPPSYWYRLDATPQSVFEEVVLRLRELAKPSPACIGVEWFVRRFPASAAQGWHFDKDEAVFRHERRLVHPEVATVLYLSTGGGDTVVAEVRAADVAAGIDSLGDVPTVYSPAVANRFLVFAGDLMHQVEPVESAALRTTMLLNWWTHEPQGNSHGDRELTRGPSDAQPAAHR